MKTAPRARVLMARRTRNWSFILMLAAVIVPLSRAADPLPLPAVGNPIDPRAGRWTFSLLPKSFQRNPELDMTVLCELTPYGRTLPQASRQSPLYYVSKDAGAQQLGVPTGGDALPDPVYLNHVIEHSLAANGYLAASPGGPDPALVLIFHWGAHHSFIPDKDWSTPSFVSFEERFRGVLERARLIGSDSLAHEIKNKVEFGFPVVDRGFRAEFLNYQAENDLYYVVISAYDSLLLQQQNEHRLVWRARLTVNAQAVAMNEALPPLVLTASSVFGRDTKGPEIVMRQLHRGVVKLAPLEILDVGFSDSAH